MSDFSEYADKIVRVVWRDAHFFDNDWVVIDNIKVPNKSNLIESVGRLIKQDKHSIVLAMNYNKRDKMCSVIFSVTKAQVIEIHEIK